MGLIAGQMTSHRQSTLGPRAVSVRSHEFIGKPPRWVSSKTSSRAPQSEPTEPPGRGQRTSTLEFEYAMLPVLN